MEITAIVDLILFVSMIVLLGLIMSRTQRERPLNEELPLNLFIFGILALTVFRTFTDFGDHIALRIANNLFLVFINVKLLAYFNKNKLK